MFVAVVSLALFSGQAYAQRYLPGMMGVELRGGFAGGSKGPLNYYTGMAMSGYTKKANRWVAGAEYLLKNYNYRNVAVPRAQFTAEGGYYLKFLSDPSKTLFLSIGGSALIGYETVNWGNRMMHDGSRLLAGDAFLYGGCAHAGAGNLHYRPCRPACQYPGACPVGRFIRRLHDTVRAGTENNNPLKSQYL